MLQYPASWRKKNQFIESMLAIVKKRKVLQKPRILSNKRKCNTFLSSAASYTLTCLKSFHTVWPSVSGMDPKMSRLMMLLLSM